jgi:hypothetical protein
MILEGKKIMIRNVLFKQIFFIYLSIYKCTFHVGILILFLTFL